MSTALKKSLLVEEITAACGGDWRRAVEVIRHLAAPNPGCKDLRAVLAYILRQ